MKIRILPSARLEMLDASDFYVEPNEHVYPMVPSGKGLHEMELGTLA